MRPLTTLTFGVLLLPASALAATFLVTPASGGAGVPACTNDAASPKTQCNLEEALAVAINNGESDTIELTAGSGGNYSIANTSTPNTTFSGGSNDGTSLTIVGAGMGQTVLDGAGMNTVLSLGVGAGDITVRDLTIQNGKVPAAASSGWAAGLMGNVTTGTFTVERVELKNNLDGQRAGGAHLQATTTGTVLIKDCVITGNTGASGASANGVDIWSNLNGAIQFIGNRVQNNVDDDTTVGGVSLYNVSGGSTITVLSNLVTGNEGTSMGGIKIHTYSPTASAHLVVANNIVAANKSTMGLDLYAAGGISILLDTNLPGTIDVVNNTLVGNTALEAAGGVFIYPGIPQGESFVTTSLSNNVFFTNSAPAGTGRDVVLRANTGTTPTFNVLHNLESEACFTADGIAFNCDLASAALVNVAGEVHVDPLFVAVASGDFHLRSGSPAIDAGDNAAPNLPTTDFAAARRISGPSVDLGALEAQPQLAVTPTPIDFAEIVVNATATHIVTIANQGTGALSVSALALSSGAPFSLDVSSGQTPCGSASFVLAGETSCNVRVVFVPTALGAFDATLTITSDDPASSTSTVAVSGVGSSKQGTDQGCSCSQLHSGRPTLDVVTLAFLLGAARLRLTRRRR